ncbi:MAG TPA: methyltransferase domain-containing protein [Stellaceae bacterium]|jgi:SAM-dependent methyltransferase|nr:methyltransferase domain-containing protein [Stellaceae bacterium]
MTENRAAGRGLPTVEVTPGIDSADAEGVRRFYVNSTVQPFAYDNGPEPYASLVVEAVASFEPTSVLEFGCGSGRNLALLRNLTPARLTGVDINPAATAWGRENFGLELHDGDEAWLLAQAENIFDIVYTVSVIDHIPVPEPAIAALVRAAADLVIVYEIMHAETGRLTRAEGADGTLVEGYPFSYFHDYRRLFETAGAWLVADVAFPVGQTGVLPFYRLQVYAKSAEWRRHNLVRNLLLWRPPR